METLEAIICVAIGFAPTLIALKIGEKIGKKRAGLSIGPVQPAFVMQGSGLDQADFEGFGDLPKL